MAENFRYESFPGDVFNSKYPLAKFGEEFFSGFSWGGLYGPRFSATLRVGGKDVCAPSVEGVFTE